MCTAARTWPWATGRSKKSVIDDNTAVGYEALFNTTGGGNIGIGAGAGVNLTTGGDNIDIFDEGQAADGTGGPGTGVIRIGTPANQNATFIAGIFGATPVDSGIEQAVVVDDTGNLGSIDISSLTTGATGDVGPTGPTGPSGLNYLSGDTSGNSTASGYNALLGVDHECQRQ